MFRRTISDGLRGVGVNPGMYRSHSRETPGIRGQLTRVQKYSPQLIGDPRSEDRFNWAIDRIKPSLVFDWYDTDFTSPNVGPELDAIGSTITGKPMPFKHPDGSYLTRRRFSPTGAFQSFSFTDPTDTQDIVAIALTAGNTNATRLIATYGGSGRGFQMAYNPTSVNGVQCISYGDTSRASFGAAARGSLFIAGFMIERGGNQKVYVNGQLADTDPTPAGSLASGQIAVGTLPGVAPVALSSICRVMLFYDDNLGSICDDDWWLNLANSITGNMSHNSGEVSNFTRDSPTTVKVSGTYFLLSENMPPIGNEEGYHAQGSRTSKLLDTIYPSGAGWAATGGLSPSTPNDWTELENDDIHDFGPNVIQLNNTTGSSQLLYNTNQMGNTNPHSMNIRTRFVSGVGFEYGWRDVSSGLFTKVGDCVDNYVETISNNLTPPDSDAQFAINTPAGGIINVSVPSVEEKTFASTPIPNYSDAVTALRDQDKNDSGILPDGTKGQISGNVQSFNWDDVSPEDAYFFASSGGDGLWAIISTLASRVVTNDGTNEVQSDTAAITGNIQSILTSWGAGAELMYIGVEGKNAEIGDFDGDMAPSGSWDFGARSAAAPFAKCSNLSLRRNPGSFNGLNPTIQQVLFGASYVSVNGLTVSHLRGTPTIDALGNAVAQNDIRYSAPRLHMYNSDWSDVLEIAGVTLQWGVGTDRDGSPLLLTIDTGGILRIYNGDDLTLLNTKLMRTGDKIDMMQGAVPDKQLVPLVLHAVDGQLWSYGYVRDTITNIVEAEAMVYSPPGADPADRGNTWHLNKTVDGEDWHTPIPGSSGILRTALWAFSGLVPSLNYSGLWVPRTDYIANTGSPGGMAVLSKIDGDGNVRNSRKIAEKLGTNCHAHSLGVLERDGLLYCLVVFGDGSASEFRLVILTDPENYETCNLITIEGWMGQPIVSDILPQGIQPASLVTLEDHSGWVAGSDNELGPQIFIQLPDDPFNEPPKISHVGGFSINAEQGNLGLFNTREIGEDGITGMFEPRAESPVTSDANRSLYSRDGQHWDEIGTTVSKVKFYGNRLIRQNDKGTHYQLSDVPRPPNSKKTNLYKEACASPGGINRISTVSVDNSASGATWSKCQRDGDGRYLWPSGFSKSGEQMPVLPSLTNHVYAFKTTDIDREIATVTGALSEVTPNGRAIPRIFVLSNGSGAFRICGYRWANDATGDFERFMRWAPTEHWLPLLPTRNVVGSDPYQWQARFFSDNAIARGDVEFAVAFDNVIPGNWPGYPLPNSGSGDNERLTIGGLALGSEFTLMGRLRPLEWDSSMAFGLSECLLFTEYSGPNDYVQWSYIPGASADVSGSIRVRVIIEGTPTDITLDGVWLNKESPLDFWRSQESKSGVVGVCVGNEKAVTDIFNGVMKPSEIRYMDLSENVTPVLISALWADTVKSRTTAEILSLRTRGDHLRIRR